MSKEELQLHYENFVHYNSKWEGNEKYTSALDKSWAGNKYFAENTDLTGFKVAEMILKMQKHLFEILPSSKNPDYEINFARFNRLIRFCKEVVKDTRDSAGGAKADV